MNNRSVDFLSQGFFHLTSLITSFFLCGNHWMTRNRMVRATPQISADQPRKAASQPISGWMSRMTCRGCPSILGSPIRNSQARNKSKISGSPIEVIQPLTSLGCICGLVHHWRGFPNQRTKRITWITNRIISSPKINRYNLVTVGISPVTFFPATMSAIAGPNWLIGSHAGARSVLLFISTPIPHFFSGSRITSA